MKQVEDRYFLFEESDGSLSICDRNAVQAERDHRVVKGLGQEQATELIEKLNSRQNNSAK